MCPRALGGAFIMTVSSSSRWGPAWSNLAEPIVALPYTDPAMKARPPGTQTCGGSCPVPRGSTCPT